MDLYKSKRLFIVFFVLIFFIGLYARCKLLFLNLGINCDEAKLFFCMKESSFLELFLPLQHAQVAPPMFLVISKLIYSITRFYNSPDFSDFVLKMFPFVSGIASIPLFGYLTKRLFKSDWIALLAMGFIATNPVAISYSCTFKQYSTEMLISIIIMIITTHITLDKNKFKNDALLFLALALSPLFSMSALFLFPAVFLYLFSIAIENKQLKNYFKLLIIFFTAFMLYVWIILYPVILGHYGYMNKFWERLLYKNSKWNIFEFFNNYFKHIFRYDNHITINVLSNIFLFSSILLIFKNLKISLLLLLPIITTFLALITKHYPFVIRFMLFLLPFFILVIVYIFKFIYTFSNEKKDIFVKVLILINILFFYYSYFVIHTDNLVVMQESGKVLWKYFTSLNDNETMLVLLSSVNTNKYYYQLFKPKNDIIKIDKTNPKLGSGEYILLITKENGAIPLLDKLLSNAEVIMFKQFPTNQMMQNYRNGQGYFIRIRIKK